MAVKSAPLPRPNVKPLADRLFVLVTDGPTESAGGIALPPSQTRDEVLYGVVVAVGPGRIPPGGSVPDPMHVHVGEQIAFPRFSGNTVSAEGITYRVLAEGEVLAIIGGES